MLRIPRTLAACGVALLVFAGCSGDDDKDAAPATTAPAAAGATTTVRPVDTSFTGQGSAQFCEQVRTYNERFTSINANPTPAELRVSTREAQTALREAQSSAPAEIKNDVDVLAGAFVAFLAELEKVDFDISRLSPGAVSQLQAPEFQASSTRLDAYTRNVCRLGG